MADTAFMHLLGRASAADVAAVAERMGAAARSRLVANAFGAPDALLHRMLAHGEHSDRACLAADREFRAKPGYLRRYDSPLWALYTLGDPELRPALYRTDSPLMCRLILAGGPPGCLPPDRRVQAGLIPIGPMPTHPTLRSALLGSTDYRLLAPAVVAADPDLVRHALRTLGTDGRLTRAERALALLRLWDAEGPDAVREWTREQQSRYRGLHRQLHEALDNPKVRADVETTILDAAGPEGFVRRLCAIESPTRSRLNPAAAVVATAPHTFEWPAVVRAHHRSPFLADDVGQLVQRHGLDHDVLRAMVGTDAHGHPYLSNWRASEGVDDGDLTTCLLDACEPVRTADAPSVADLVADAAPGWVFLENYAEAAAQTATSRRLRERFALVDAELARLVRARLGDDVERWVRLARIGPAWPGTLPDLLDATADPDAADEHAAEGPIWADRDYLRHGPLGRAPGRQRHAAMRRLLRETAPETVARIAARLPAAFTADLYGRPGGARLDAALCTLGAPAVDVGIHTCPRTPPQVREFLLRTRTPALYASLIGAAEDDFGARLSRLREHGRATVYETLLACRAAIGSGQATVVERLAYGVLRPGFDGVYERESLGIDVAGIVRRARAAPPAEADVLLREAAQDWVQRARAGGVVELLATGGARGYLETTHDPGWAAILAAHRADPLPVPALEALAEARPDLPAELTRALAEHVGAYCDSAHIAEHSWTLARSLLRGVHPFGGRARPAAEWPDLITRALDAGTLDPGLWAAHGRPAATVLRTLSEAAHETVPDAVGRALAEAVERHLAGRPDAWVTAYAMLPDFTGTVAELLATAEAAAGPGGRRPPPTGPPG
ncbi:hypothetical protein ACFZBU_13840 [Embleya sp. NPDC008237]|uniref:hypothetical protein n=1 Tax=Embleya sp. NPDC008237 TaxID=3363978 RepID=UPI0036E784DC